ncbi:kinase domain protein (macronuclear) [Tetrahymena thermophila SB210]|uniref:Kinase domain protein n=1 Tax=Tetrahymena thermophila (strain SB210) TaxID=312017 RepID=Q23E75_TETTS|nr:kinase domain protein [Tetrahymena thermophila SB210]EAR94878.2 kinase domain protein [Tetrahymena thermophila SB210]|eukprot:XP_001015123.2 kinase domain protein [Tetrahymena thermophila SB210]
MQNRIFVGQKSKYQQNKNTIIQGGQAQIYFAIDSKNYQQVVIKEYFKDSSFQVDYEVLKKIQDKYSENLENLVKIYDQSSEKEKMKFIVIEYCNEGDLYTYHIKKQQEVQTFEQALEVIDIAIQITKGMMILKELNLAHRDLKPENILIHNDGEKIIAKISDYGLTKEVQRDLKSIVGTPNYMAPEILSAYKKGSVYDDKIDVWSFGLILYEMFTCKCQQIGYKMPLKRSQKQT